MKKNFKLLLAALTALGLVGAAAACSTTPDNSSTPEASTPAPATYTVTFVADGVTVDTVTYTEGDASILEPEVPAKDHYTGVWEAYTLDGDVTVNAVYTLKEYKVTFVADGATVATEGYTIDNTTVTAPEVPAKEGYTGAWEAYELTSGDVTVNAVYTAIEYTLTFTDSRTGMLLAAPITFTVETIDQIVFPAVPSEGIPEGYEVKWNKTVADLGASDCDVNPVLVAIEYQVRFVHPRTGMDIAEPITYTVENMADVVFPEIPEGYLMAGYTMSWDKTAADLEIGGLVVALAATANTYTITYELNGGSTENDLTAQEVVFDSEYELLVASPAKSYQSFLGWKDEDGNMVAAEGIWAIASDVTLTAVYSDGIDFTNGAVPAFLSTNSQTKSLSVVELNGNKVLKMEGSGTNHGLNVTIEFLNEVFADPNVQYLAFDAKSETTHHTNFRRSTIRTTGTIGSWGQEPYESDTQAAEPQGTVFCQGIRPDAFKTFFFTRTDYNNWVSNNITADMLISAGNFATGENLYVDNIRPVTQAQYNAANYGLETGGIRPNGGNLLVYYGNTGGTWQFAITADDTGSGKPAFTDYGFTNENVTEGNRALMFTKAAGQVTMRFNNTSVANFVAIANATGYYAFDLYVGEGSDAVITYPSIANAVIPGHAPNVGGWMTIYCQNDTNVCVKVTDTTGGTYGMDNFRSVTAEEYQAAQYGFEAGTMGLRLNLLNDDTANSGAAYVYNKGTDYNGTKASIAIAEGNGANDVNALSNVRIDHTIVHSGASSLAFDKGNGYMYLTRHSESQALVDFSVGFTFWIYSTVEIDGVNTNNFVNGVNGKFNGGEGIIIPANTWTQVTVRPEEIGNGRFLIMQGNWSGTIYLDDFQILN